MLGVLLVNQPHQDMEIVNHGIAAGIKEIFAESAIASPLSLPVGKMSQRVLDTDALAKFGASLRAELSLS